MFPKDRGSCQVRHSCVTRSVTRSVTRLRACLAGFEVAFGVEVDLGNRSRGLASGDSHGPRDAAWSRRSVMPCSAHGLDCRMNDGVSAPKRRRPRAVRTGRRREYAGRHRHHRAVGVSGSFRSRPETWWRRRRASGAGVEALTGEEDGAGEEAGQLAEVFLAAFAQAGKRLGGDPKPRES
jgi:hypothetical protein